jgi:ribose transport system ATP-binding protein
VEGQVASGAPDPDASADPKGPADAKGTVANLRSVSMSFPGQRALDRVSLDLRGGEVLALVGQNGSGKSTLIKILAGIYEPDPGGAIEILGDPLELGSPTASSTAGLRFVHQELGLVEDLSAMENISLAAGFMRNRFGTIRWRDEARRATELLERLDVHIDVKKPVALCTAVERTAVAIARAMWDWEERGARVLVLDEPTATMPPADVQRLFALIETVRSRGAAVLYVSHRLDEIFDIAEHVCVLRDGHKVADQPMRELDARSLTQHILGHQAEVAVAPTRPRAAASGGLMPAVLELDALSGSLSKVALTVREGDILGVTGLQGSGRDELPYLLIEQIRELRARRRRAAKRGPTVLPARPAIVPVDRARSGSIPTFTVRENFAFTQAQRFSRAGLLRKSLETKALADWAERLNLAYASGEQRFATLSGGNQQKVILARWLSIRPDLMIIDEPTHGVDIGARESIHAIVREFASEGVAFLICSSDIPDLMAVSTRILVMSGHRVVESLEPDEFDEHRILEHMVSRGERRP